MRDIVTETNSGHGGFSFLRCSAPPMKVTWLKFDVHRTSLLREERSKFTENANGGFVTFLWVSILSLEKGLCALSVSKEAEVMVELTRIDRCIRSRSVSLVNIFSCCIFEGLFS